MGLKVIGAGFGRTGTLSLKVALEKLGFSKCHHMTEVFGSREQIDYWYAIAQAHDKPSWDDVFEGYQSSTDFPSSIFYKELADHFPEAKVVLTVRDEDTWYKSVEETIWAMWQAIPAWVPKVSKRFARGDFMVNKILWNDLFKGKTDDAAFAKQVFKEHNQTVQSVIPAERLLVYQVKEGWQPLCDFLGVPVPDEPFPHVNDSNSFKTRVKIVRCIAALPYLLAILLGLVVFLRLA
ncbi:MAG: sulfotransferase family protein [Pseudomonadota bacterium]